MTDQASTPQGQAPNSTQERAAMLAARLGGEPVEPPQGQEPDQPQPAGQDPADAQSQQSQQAQPKPDDLSALPEWAQKVIRDTRAEAAQYRTRTRDLEQAQMTDQQRQQQELEELRAEAASAQRFRVAAEVGLDLELAERLRGSTREELKADAETLKARFGGPSQAPPPDFDAGARPPAGGNGDGDMNAMLRSAAGRSA